MTALSWAGDGLCARWQLWPVTEDRSCTKKQLCPGAWSHARWQHCPGARDGDGGWVLLAYTSSIGS